MSHTPGAIKAAEIISCNEYGSKGYFYTAYGKKTCEGIADIIDRETAALELLKVLEKTRGYLAWHADEEGPSDCPTCAHMLVEVNAAIAKARGK